MKTVDANLVIPRPWPWLGGVGGVLLAVWLGLSAPVGARDDGRPTRLSIEPNAILRGDEPLRIDLEGVARNQPARLWVVEDCDGDGRPEEGADCPRVWHGETEPATKDGQVSHFLYFEELSVSFPRGVPLWLRASGQGGAGFRQVVFGFVDDECSILQTVIDAFVRGDCDPALAEVLREHRQPTDLTRAFFEVRRIDTDDPLAAPVAVPGTRGASGVAWLDAATLLVTAAGLPGDGHLAAGVYRVALDGEPERLWDGAPGDLRPVAPLALPGGRIAFVRQASGAQRSGAGEAVAWLAVLRPGGQLELEVALPYKVHQLLAVSGDGRSVLALSLGVADNQPVFVVAPIDGEGEAEAVGFTRALYQSLLREPGGCLSVVAFENSYALRGWELALAERQYVVRNLVKRDGRHDLAPAWRPGGGEVAYLAEIGGGR